MKYSVIIIFILDDVIPIENSLNIPIAIPSLDGYINSEEHKKFRSKRRRKSLEREFRSYRLKIPNPYQLKSQMTGQSCKNP